MGCVDALNMHGDVFVGFPCRKFCFADERKRKSNMLTKKDSSPGAERAVPKARVFYKSSVDKGEKLLTVARVHRVHNLAARAFGKKKMQSSSGSFCARCRR